MAIREGGLDEPQVIALLNIQLEEAQANPTRGGAQMLDLAGLRRPDITFWSAWNDAGDLLGYAALRELEPGHGEIKSLRTSPNQLRRGAGAALISHILGVGRERGYRRLSFETGTTPAFDAVQALCRQFGFTYCDPFGDYTADPQSRFMSRAI